MNDGIWKRNEIESPCVKLCMIHSEYKVCMGCFRTIDEIADWSNFTPARRKELIKSLKDRKKEFSPKRGGGRLRQIIS